MGNIEFVELEWDMHDDKLWHQHIGQHWYPCQRSYGNQTYECESCGAEAPDNLANAAKISQFPKRSNDLYFYTPSAGGWNTSGGFVV